MSRTPNTCHKPNLEDILNRGRPAPTWRERFVDWWRYFDFVSLLAGIGLTLSLLLLATLLIIVWSSLIQHGMTTLT